MGLPVDPDKHLIKMPAPQRIESMMNTAFPNLRGTQWTKAVPPVPHGLMADVDAALTQKIFDLSVSNSSSGRRWKLDHAPAVGDPTHMVEFGTGRRAFAREA